MKWEEKEDKGETNVHAEQQQLDAPAVDESLDSLRIEYLSGHGILNHPVTVTLSKCIM